jgi:hypothetical protein
MAIVVLLASPIEGQTLPPGPSVSVPRVMNLAGVFQPVDGQPLRAVETITVALYTDPTGGAPLWQETQSVAIDAKGSYALLLGATSAEGIPAAVLAAGAQWLGTTVDRPGEVESPRVPLTSVPYALRAADADTLGGHPASAYLLAPSSGKDSTSTTGKGSTATTTGQASPTSAEPGTPTANIVQAGTTNFLAKYVSAADVGNSAVFENAGRVGIGTTTPSTFAHQLHHHRRVHRARRPESRQHRGSYSGMLFYDQNNALGQFQGFNNVTHEYRINNIARNGGNVLDGSINFMIGGSSKFFVSPLTVGIGTTSPSPTANLDVSNAISGSGTTNVNVTTYSANAFGPNLIGKKARGTQGAPTAVQNNDALLDLSANGYGATGFPRIRRDFRAGGGELTDAAQGTVMNFTTSPTGSIQPAVRMTVSPNGNGVTLGPTSNLEVSNATNTAPFGGILTTSHGRGSDGPRTWPRGRDTAAPTAVQNGDASCFVGQGYVSPLRFHPRRMT